MKNKGLIISLIVSVLVIILLIGYIVFDKTNNNNSSNNENKEIANETIEGRYINEETVGAKSELILKDNKFRFSANICKGMVLITGDYKVDNNKLILSNLTSKYDHLSDTLMGKDSFEFEIISDDELMLNVDHFGCITNMNFKRNENLEVVDMVNYFLDRTGITVQYPEPYPTESPCQSIEIKIPMLSSSDESIISLNEKIKKDLSKYIDIAKQSDEENLYLKNDYIVKYDSAQNSKYVSIIVNVYDVPVGASGYTSSFVYNYDKDKKALASNQEILNNYGLTIDNILNGIKENYNLDVETMEEISSKLKKDSYKIALIDKNLIELDIQPSSFGPGHLQIHYNIDTKEFSQGQYHIGYRN